MKLIPQQKNLDLIFVMDRSGSMSGSEMDLIGGFNSLLEKEMENGLNTRVTTVLFDDNYAMLYKRKPICDVEKLTSDEYWVRGCTALFDAIGKTINGLDKEIDNDVLFVIMTDGKENHSREYSKDQIRALISNHDWEFLFIGADIDSYSEASHLGIKKSRIANNHKSKEGFSDVFNSISDAANCIRNEMVLDDAAWSKRLRKYD